MSVVKAGQKSAIKSVRVRSNGHNTTFLIHQKNFRFLPYIQSHNVEIKIYLEFFFNFGATKPTLTGHHDRHRPDILIKSTLADV